MKTERLYAITVYLLNHGKTSARTLARQFEVSLRTIQRDMDSLCIAGIPIAATYGADGGYEISGSFRLNEDFATEDDYSLIRTALEGLVSATGDAKARRALEKIRRAAPAEKGGIVLDFSVLQEDDKSLLRPLQEAVAERRAVEFRYTNNDGETRAHCVEPVAVVYRWYAWYLLAWSAFKNDYRTYKLARMERLRITGKPFAKIHRPAAAILEESGASDSRTYAELRLKCAASARARVLEYLKGSETSRTEDGRFIITASVVENEQFWFGTLLSLGDAVEVLSPLRIRRAILEAAEKIAALYKNTTDSCRNCRIIMDTENKQEVPMTMDPYEHCPEFEDGRFSLRLVRAEDAQDLLAVYSDKAAVPYFNSDNCHGATFYCEKLKYVQEMIDSWLAEYRGKGFVRWTIIDKDAQKAVGTVELFNRRADDYFTNCGILRLDVRSDCETEPLLFEIMQLIVPPSFKLFGCGMVATKIPPFAAERRRAAERLGFALAAEKLIGHDKTPYTDYFVLPEQ